MGSSRPADPRPDEALVEAARGGEAGAFDALVRRHFRPIYALAFRLAGNHEDAEDLAQECFVRAHRSLRWFRGDAALSTWLARIVLHLVRDRRRQAGRRPRALDVDALGDASTPTVTGPEREATDRELATSVDSALRRLPPAMADAMVLRVLQGLDYDEAAEVLGVRPGTVRTQVMRARKLLLTWLAPLLEREPDA